MLQEIEEGKYMKTKWTDLEFNCLNIEKPTITEEL